MGTIIDISLIILIIMWVVTSLLTFKQKNEQIDDLKNELDIKDFAMTATLEDVKEFYKQHFNHFVKRNKDITLEQFIEKYSDELAHIGLAQYAKLVHTIVYAPEPKTTEELLTELKNKLKELENKQE